MLAANSRELIGEKDDLAAGTDIEKVKLSAREIWDMMVPTSLALRARVVFCLVLLLVCRLANIMVPLTFKRVIDILTQIQAGGGTASAASAAAAVASGNVVR